MCRLVPRRQLRWNGWSLAIIACLAAAVHSQLTARLEHVFTSSECDAIVKLFTSMKPEVDVRQHPLLPLMEVEPFGVARVKWGDDKEHPVQIAQLYKDLLNRTRAALLEHVPGGTLDSVEAFSSIVDFVVLHEFGVHQHAFDWHVDVVPNDGTLRTLNLNIMLSRSGQDYTGGELQVGNQTITPLQGDLYLYPASLPHKVAHLQSGSRFTLCIGLTERRRMHADFDSNILTKARSQAYWTAAEDAFRDLTSGSLAGEPKVHILFGKFFEAAGRIEEAQAAFCQSYRATTNGVQYSHMLFASGMDMLVEEQPNLKVVESYFSMAACVNPQHPEAAAALGDLRHVLEHVLEGGDLEIANSKSNRKPV